MRRSVLFTVLGLATLGAAVGLSMLGLSRRGITLQNFEKIHGGMTQRQVEAILGGPPRSEVQAQRPSEGWIHGLRKNIDWPAEWWGRRGVIAVYYDENGRVFDKSFKELPFEPKPPSLWDYLFFRA